MNRRRRIGRESKQVDLESKCERLDDLCGQMLATLKLNIERGNITTESPTSMAEFKRLIGNWQQFYDQDKAKPPSHGIGGRYKMPTTQKEWSDLADKLGVPHLADVIQIEKPPEVKDAGKLSFTDLVTGLQDVKAAQRLLDKAKMPSPESEGDAMMEFFKGDSQ